MIKEKRSSLVNRKGVIFHHDNARPHSARITCYKIEELGWKKFPHPPYSLDIAPSDYHLFRSLQHFTDGKEYPSRAALETDLQYFYSSEHADFYKSGTNKLVKRWENVIHSDGYYIID